MVELTTLNTIATVNRIILYFGNKPLSFLIESMPSDFINGVPASIQSTPPDTDSFATRIALSIFKKSSATCSMGFIIWFCYAFVMA